MTSREIAALVRKSAKRLNSFFYVGVVVGTVMGPLVIVGSFIPAVVDIFSSEPCEVTIMRAFGIGMTVLFGIAIVEQINKVRQDRKLLASVVAHPERIVRFRKEVSEARKGAATIARFVHVHFSLRDGSRAKVWLPEPEADRLIDLLEGMTVILCPYCAFPIGEESGICPACGDDTTRDAPFEMTLAEYAAEERTACPKCGAEMLSLAVRCPVVWGKELSLCFWGRIHSLRKAD